MANNALSIGRAPDIKFKPVAALPQAKLKRLQSIFRNVSESASSAMPQKKRIPHFKYLFFSALSAYPR
jgi:hypothetical protein